MALQRVFPIIDVFIYLHCCKAGQAAPRNSNSIFDLLDKWVRYQMNGRANKWAKTSNMNLLRTHETTHGYSQPASGQFSQWKSFMFIRNANQSRLLASLLTDTSASQSTTSAGKKTPQKNTCQFISASRCLTLGMKRTFFFVIIWFTWTLSISRQWGGQ